MGRTVEQVLDQIGVGNFQFVALLAVGLSFSYSTVAWVSMALILPSLTAEFSLDAAQQSLVITCVYPTQVVGSILAGFLADNYGRKVTVVSLQFWMVIFAIVMACSPYYWLLVCAQTFAGIGIGGSFAILTTYFVEFLPVQGRGPFLVSISYFYLVGQGWNAGIGWAIIPRWGWRTFVATNIILSLVATTLTLLFMPEGPRFLMMANKPVQALKVLDYIARVNKKRKQFEVDVGSVELILNEENEGQTKSERSLGQLVQESWQRYVSLFRSQNMLWTTTFVLLFAVILQAMANLIQPWFPTLFEYFGEQSLSIYVKNFIMIAGSIPGNLLSVVLVDWIGRKMSTMAGFSVFAAGMLVIIFSRQDTIWPIVGACIANGMINHVFNISYAWIPEQFPTDVRSSGMSLMYFMGQISAFLFAYLAGVIYGIDKKVPLMVEVCLALAAIIVVLYLPETKGMSLKDKLTTASSTSNIESDLRQEDHQTRLLDQQYSDSEK
eukprot:TRINITY_DN1646_c1_g1_i1.p2 TRINITY_DN1646_c1_g1~~TRINITY_DN1646_c1_g1_i1.p2  ORF type:complete len:494 (-),score=19.79 TRINITY_DN1646_c1_g1_i1:131-1612(-)